MQGALVHGYAEAVSRVYRLGRARSFGVFDAADLSAFRNNFGAIFQCRPSAPRTFKVLRLERDSVPASVRPCLNRPRFVGGANS